jgi:flagellar biosynthesis/type III secretory pathway chaperone
MELAHNREEEGLERLNRQMLREIGLLREMLDLLSQERTSILENQKEALREIIDRRHSLMAELSQVRTACSQAVAEIHRVFSQSNELEEWNEVVFHHIIEHIFLKSPESAAMCDALYFREQIIALLQEIEKRARDNCKFMILEKKIWTNALDTALSVMHGDGYTAEGKKKKKVLGVMLLDRADDSQA